MATFIVASPISILGSFYANSIISGDDALERAKAVAQVLANRDGSAIIWQAEKVLEFQKDKELS